ncbi:MAG: Long-chain-fatty-acid--CoA ligase FadD15 [Alphaproteobacteria bacterium MarineAlpha2_Bin1]|nr:MAG: Long-chain-fatty-acid--CoA ligase FadD15 [Alphaproteobacteria bacterium MarineAlpha2_Bin1]
MITNKSQKNSNYHKEEIKTLPLLLQYHAKTKPKEVAIRQKRFGIWNEVTWKEYEKEASRFGSALLAQGLKKFDNVGILSENRKEWLIAESGMHLVGIIPVGVYPTSPANEILHILLSTDIKVIVCEDQEQVDKILEIEHRLPLLKKIIYIDHKGLSSYNNIKLLSWDKLLEDGIKKIETNPKVIYDCMKNHSAEDIALIVPTSGSTGPPKPAMISFKNIFFIGHASEKVIKRGRRDNVLSYLPLCHVAEQLFSVFNAMHSGYTANFGESIRTIQQDLRDIAPTIFLGVPRIWEKMQSDILIQSKKKNLQSLVLKKALKVSRKFNDPWKKYNIIFHIEKFLWEMIAFRHVRNGIGLTKCRIAISGAAPISQETLKFFRGLGMPLMEGFGMTETSGACTIQSLDKASKGSIGFPFEGVSLKIAEDGELLIKGGCVFAGYYKDPISTQDSIKDGWLFTGDIAKVFSDGSASIIDRKKDIVITSAGKNLSPSIIENTIKVSPYIKECILIADGRRFPSALIQIDFDAVANWAESESIPYTNFKNLVQRQEVFNLISKEIEIYNNNLSNVEKIKKFIILKKELDHDDGEVTATMKVRRSQIEKVFSSEINLMYS